MCPELLHRFAAVSDGRRDQGRVHPVAVVLALCAAAVVAGMSSFTAIAGWAADVPAELLAQLYGQCAEPPSKATIWRVVTGADAAAVDAVIGAWLARQSTAREPGTDPSALVAIAVDGKTVRGATDAEGNQVHLLAAATHTDALVLGQVEVGAKTHEIPMFAPLLDRLAVTGVDLAPDCLATLIRQHWGIESLHWLRDTHYREDNSTIHTRSGPRAMTALRNLAIGAIRLTGRHDITKTTRPASRHMDRPFKILKLIA